jgi:nucleoside-diphosphate-sugar epimerase
MRIFVTGASGFIGKALAPALEARGHEVRGSGRDDSSENSLAGCDAIVHLANIAHSRASREALQRVNVEGTRRLAERAAAANVRRLVYLSSIKASGEETFDRPFDAGEAPSPQNEYGRTKLAAEGALAEVCARSGLQSVVLRPPLVYGPGVKANFLALIKAIDAGWPLPFARIENRRSLVYVGNLVDAIVRCIELPQAAGRTYVVSDAAPISTVALCRAIADALSRPARLFALPSAVLELIPQLRPLCRDLELSNARLRDELGWAPPFSFEESLAATARWYRGG